MMAVDKTPSRAHRIANASSNQGWFQKAGNARALVKLASAAKVKESTLKALITGDREELGQTKKDGTYKHSSREIDKARGFLQRAADGQAGGREANESAAAFPQGVLNSAVRTGGEVRAGRMESDPHTGEKFEKSGAEQRFSGEAKKSGLFRNLKQGLLAPRGRSAKATVADGLHYAGVAGQGVATGTKAATKYAGAKATVATKYAGEKATAATKYVGEKATDATKYVGEKATDATKYVGGKATSATKYVGEKATDATKYVGQKAVKAKDTAVKGSQAAAHAAGARLGALKNTKLGRTDRYTDLAKGYQALAENPKAKPSEAELRGWFRDFAKGRDWGDKYDKTNWVGSELRHKLETATREGQAKKLAASEGSFRRAESFSTAVSGSPRSVKSNDVT